MEREVDNANPTILSAAQLPTRRKKGGVAFKGPESRYEEIVNYKPSYLFPPYSAPGAWTFEEEDDDDDSSDGPLTEEPIDEQEIYDLISTISDPEHPLSLGQLAVVNLPDIHITPPPSLHDRDELVTVLVEITPTITHCSLATVIGLGIRVRLEKTLPPNYRIDVRIKANTHAQDDQVNKQLADRERVAAALENETLRGVLDKMLETCV